MKSGSEQMKNTFPLTQSDVREVLQYVPIFSGHTFVVALDGQRLSDTLTAELLLDLITLQNIGVKLIIAYYGKDQTHLLDWAAEVELKLSFATPEGCDAILERGQAALVLMSPEMSFGQSLVDLAVSAQAQKVLYLGRVADYPEVWKGALNLKSAQLAVSGISSELTKWATCAVSLGVSRVHLLDGDMYGCLSRELFSNEGVGVMIYTDSYLEVRPLSEEDIPELLAIIGRSIRAQYLVPRSYEEVESQLDDYYVMTIDGNVVGSVAIHPFSEQRCELACLFVKGSHKGLGYGHDLVKFAEEKARQIGFKTIFALSTDANGFFEDQLHYVKIPLEQIPKLRLEKLKNSGRSSVALQKVL